MIHPIVFNELIILIANSFVGQIDPEEMDVLGNFFSSLGAIILFNSSYLSRLESLNKEGEQEKDNHDQDENKDLEMIKESIEKINEKIKSIKFDK